MADDLTETRHYTYISSTVIYTLFVVFVSVWLDRRNRNKDKKEASRKEDEDKRKADLEKIMAYFSQNYDEVNEIFQDLKKSVDVLKERKINTRSRTFTEFDVLLYMCHADNSKKFEKKNPFFRNPKLRLGFSGREKIMSNVKKIMKFINEVCDIQLSVIHKTCPDIIRSNFSTEVIEMCKTIHPFVTKTGQEHIKSVLIYFEETPAQEDQQVSPGWMQRCFQCIQQCFQCIQTHVSRCYHCCVRQSMHEPETQRLASTPGPSNAVDIEMTGQSSANEEANEELMPYCGHEAIENAIPYIESFKYEYGKMTCDLMCADSCIKTFESCVEKENILEVTKVAISKEIKTLWEQYYGSDLAGDLLHLIRMVMFKLSKDLKFSRSESLRDFVQYVGHIANSAFEVDRIRTSCELSLRRIEDQVKGLREAKNKKHLKDQSVREFLQHHATSLERFIASKLKIPQHESQGNRRSSSLPNISHACELA
jgi:hypothetical protein